MNNTILNDSSCIHAMSFISWGEVFTILAISTYIITILALYFIMRDDFLSRKEKIIGLLTLIFWPIIAIIVSIHNGYKYLTRSENND